MVVPQIATYHNKSKFLSEVVRCGAIPKTDWMGVYLAYIPIQADEGSAAGSLLSQKLFGVRRVADVFYRKRECRGIVLKRTAHGTLLFGIGRRCALITPNKKRMANIIVLAIPLIVWCLPHTM